ncbi:uncharacterized protein LOC109836390 [Asparagus officinalis]|uniref:uncharacterized protein LOC109836390 n=1 Tax=Asparagus officinalis TaxID=4686 RepID=UPI00098DE7E1|nr:uncharacterized protein LOC109836390 [Asparagus officinalis]
MDGDGEFMDEESIVNICQGAALSVFVIVFTFMRRMQSRHGSIHSGPSEEKRKQKRSRIEHIECLDRWIEDKRITYAKLREYANKSLVHYDDLALIIGEDQARGGFANNIWKKFSHSEPINLGDDLDSPLPTDQSPQVHTLDDEDTPRPKEAPTSSTSKAKSCASKGKVRRTNLDNELMQQMVDKMKIFSASMKFVNMHWTEKLSNVVYAHLQDFSVDKLDAFYRRLFVNENESRLFMGISPVGQKEMINSFLFSKDRRTI